jgi:toxin HigB-1
VIRSFSDKESKKLYITGKSRKLPADIIRQTLRKLEQISSAGRIEDLMTFPGNKLERLKGRMKGKYSIRINDQWRILFSFAKGDAYDVEITDYHK